MSDKVLTCREVIELLSDYVEDALPTDKRRSVEEHLAGCDACTAYLDQMRETIRLSGMITEEQVPEEQKQALLTAFRDWPR